MTMNAVWSNAYGYITTPLRSENDARSWSATSISISALRSSARSIGDRAQAIAIDYRARDVGQVRKAAHDIDYARCWWR